jgi:hypothetical protein
VTQCTLTFKYRPHQSPRINTIVLDCYIYIIHLLFSFTETTSLKKHFTTITPRTQHQKGRLIAHFEAIIYLKSKKKTPSVIAET